MSGLRTMAEAEADAVEAAEEEETAEPEPEPTPEPEPEPEPVALAAAEIDMEKVERAHSTYLNAIGRILGDGKDQLIACPTCSVWPFAGFQPFEAPPPLRDLDDTETCATCNGYGVTLTKSLVEAQRLKPCTSCGSSGYRTVAMPEPEQPAWATVTPISPPSPWPEHEMPFVPLVGGSPDRWNRPAGHPRWGLEPLAPMVGGVSL